MAQRILLLEDEQSIADTLLYSLTNEGFEVQHVRLVGDALAAFQARAPDLAILDVNLRGSQSFPVAEVLAGRGVPFLFATGYGATILKPPYNGTPTLQKPFQLDDLRQILALSVFQSGG